MSAGEQRGLRLRLVIERGLCPAAAVHRVGRAAATPLASASYSPLTGLLRKPSPHQPEALVSSQTRYLFSTYKPHHHLQHHPICGALQQNKLLGHDFLIAYIQSNRGLSAELAAKSADDEAVASMSNTARESTTIGWSCTAELLRSGCQSRWFLA